MSFTFKAHQSQFQRTFPQFFPLFIWEHLNYAISPEIIINNNRSHPIQYWLNAKVPLGLGCGAVAGWITITDEYKLKIYSKSFTGAHNHSFAHRPATPAEIICSSCGIQLSEWVSEWAPLKKNPHTFWINIMWTGYKGWSSTGWWWWWLMLWGVFNVNNFSYCMDVVLIVSQQKQQGRVCM